MVEAITWCARGPFCWGKGNTREEAVRNARKNWPGPPYVSITRQGARDKHFSLWTFPCVPTAVWFDQTEEVFKSASKPTKVQTSSLATPC